MGALGVVAWSGHGGSLAGAHPPSLFLAIHRQGLTLQEPFVGQEVSIQTSPAALSLLIRGDQGASVERGKA